MFLIVLKITYLTFKVNKEIIYYLSFHHSTKRFIAKLLKCLKKVFETCDIFKKMKNMILKNVDIFSLEYNYVSQALISGFLFSADVLCLKDVFQLNYYLMSKVKHN